MIMGYEPTTLGCKHIGIKKFELVKKTQFSVLLFLELSREKSESIILEISDVCVNKLIYSVLSI